MKKALLSMLILGIGVFTISCGSEDESTPKNYVTFDGETYGLSPANSYYLDWGCDSHCNYDFYLVSSNFQVSVYLELYQLTDGSFTGGTFTALSEVPGNYFDDDDLTIGETSYAATTGTVTATSQGEDEWELEFAYSTASGSYEGYYNGSLEFSGGLTRGDTKD